MKDVNNCLFRAIDDAIERVGALIALRKAPESLPPSRFASDIDDNHYSYLVVLTIAEKRNKRPRAPSPSGTPIPVPSSIANSRSVSITLPPRTNSVGPTAHSRESMEVSAIGLESCLRRPSA